MNFLRAYFNIFLMLCLMAFIATIAVLVRHFALTYHIIGPNDYFGAGVIGFLSGIITTLLLLPIIWWYMDKYL